MRVPRNDPHAYAELHEREGVVTFSLALFHPHGVTGAADDPTLMVRFDGDEADTNVFESWLASA